MKFVIEHLESKLYEWCLIEYEHISKIVGKENLIFTKVTNQKEAKILSKYGEVKKESVLNLNFKKACLLEPKSKVTLSPKDTKEFDYFIFGGILGDFPEQGRTEKYLTSKLKDVETRNLLDKQMSTDTAVLVAHIVLTGTPMQKIRFIDEPNIIIKKGKYLEEINLPFRYVEKDGKPIMSTKLIKYLKKKDSI
jgi:ribosome biogenesis SPOUT family RNA methylase Rps3